MTVTLAGFSPALAAIIQDNSLQRTFQEVLFPRLLFRSEAVPEKWEANIGDTKTFTRAGKLPVSVRPLLPGQDPTPKAYATEQFRVTADQYGDRLQTHMPTARAALPGKFLLDTQKLGENAGETMNRLCRNRLYLAYTAGDTVTIVAATAGQTTLRVASLNGFREQVTNGVLGLVSPATSIEVEVGPAHTRYKVIAAQPDEPIYEPDGPGTLTLATPLGGNLAVRSPVRALSRSRIIRTGGAVTVDNIAAGSTLKVDDVIQAVQLLRGQGVPPHSDGLYHVHIPVEGVTQLYRDPDFKALNHPAPTEGMYANLTIARFLACDWFQNSECPNQLNSGDQIATGTNARASSEIGAEVVNEAGVPIARTIVTGGGALVEEWIPEEEYGTEAGYNGKVGNFNVTNAGVSINTDRVRYILRRPQDVLQQIVDQAWSWSGDFAAPSDLLGGVNGARFKRGVVIEHAGA